MTRYNYICVSKSGARIVGWFDDYKKFNRDELTRSIMHSLHQVVVSKLVPWDPFNIELIVKAQKEPKP